MKMTSSRLKSIISEEIGRVISEHGPDLKGYSKLAIEVATKAIAIVGYPQDWMIENEIHQMLAPMSGISDDDKWIIADEALSVAGIMLGVGPDALGD